MNEMNRLLAVAFLFAALCNPVAAGELEDMIARAEQGDVIDHYELGMAYYFGDPMPQDYKQAYVWLSVAVTNGYDEAAAKRDKAALQLTPDVLAEAQAEAATLDKKINPPRE
ncbi:MAG: sel1 repeat family protein [Xanthomonadales bacterium]|nr:sel1 repeat family protein [Xanthomonadales bacterium]